MTRTKSTSFITIGKDVAKMNKEMKRKDETIKELLAMLVAAKNRINTLNSYFKHPNFTDRYGDRDANERCLMEIDYAISNATITP